MKLKLLFGLILVTLGFLFSASNVKAENLPTTPTPQPTNGNYFNTNPDVPKDFSTYTQSVIIQLTAAASCQIMGINPSSPDSKCLGLDSKTGKIGFVENGGGLIGITSNMIAMTFQIPVSSTHYGVYLANSFGVAKPAYAQIEDNTEGSAGFNGLKPLLPLWKTFRNLTYLLFVTLFVIIGVGVMLRIKIDPRTVMSIQNQIPKIIIAIVFVTFSYAIAGFLVDMMYVSLYLVYNILGPHISGLDKLDPTRIQGANPITAVGSFGGIKIALAASGGIGNIIGSLFDGQIGNIVAGVIGALIGGAVGSHIPGVNLIGGGVVGGVLGGLGGAIAGTKLLALVGSMIAFLVIGIAILSALFRLWFQLLKAYIYLLISIVLGPFYIASGLIPGRSGFGSWIRGLLSNLIVFPTVFGMFLFGKIFIDEFGTKATPDNLNFVPPFIGNPGNTSSFGALIGLGIILMTPEVVNMMHEAFKSPDFKYSAAIGKSLGAGTGVIGSPISQTWKTLTRVSQTGAPIGFLPNKLVNSGGSLGPRISNFLFGTHNP